MKNLTKIFMAVVAGMFAFSCVTDTTEDLGVNIKGGEKVTEVTLSMEAARTHLGEKDLEGKYPLYWSEGDAISVNGVASNEIIIGDKEDVALFKFAEAVTTPLCVVYPAAAAQAAEEVIEGEETETPAPVTVYPVNFLATQPYTVGTFAPQAAPMYGYTETAETIVMQHLTGVLRFAIAGNGEKVTNIAVRAQNGKIAGAFTIDCANGTLTAVEASNTVNVTFAEPLVLGEEATPVYVTVPAGSYGTFVITITTEAHEKMTLKFNSDVKPITAATVREFKPFVYEANTNDSEDVFIIDSEEALIEFAKIASVFFPRTTAKVTATLDMSGYDWTPIENFGAFEFDGGSEEACEIQGLKAPLFGTTNANISNVALTNVNYTVTDLAHSGAIACKLMGGSLNNCSAAGKININNTTLAEADNNYNGVCHAGLVGFASAATITNSTNDIDITITSLGAATLESRSTVGGVIGGVSEGCTIDGLTNSGDITYVGTTLAANCYISGVVGKSDNTNGQNDFKSINNCTNTGAISTAKGSKSTASVLLAGITGQLHITEDTVCEKLINTGHITHNGEANNMAASGILSYTAKASFKDCSNSGNVTVVNGAKSNTGIYLSGLCAGNDASVFGQITGFTNTGNITIQDGVSATNVHLAGIIATNTDNYATLSGMSNCSNTGAISIGNVALNGECQAVGLGGYVHGVAGKTNSLITNCTNSGPISVTASNTSTKQAARLYVGGLFFRLDGIDVSSCTNETTGTITLKTGNWSSGHFPGGLIAYLGGAGNIPTYKITDCENKADLWAEAITDCAAAYGEIGGAFAEAYYDVGDFHIEFLRVKNSGNVTVKGNYSTKNKTYVGGFFGTTNFDHLDFNDCHNSGDVLFEATAQSPCVGGFIGYCTTNESFKAVGCTNSGDVNYNTIALTPDSKYAAVRCGGFIGYRGTGVTSLIKSCINTGKITLKEGQTATISDWIPYCLGGFIGQNAGNKLTMEDCTNGELNDTTGKGKVYAGNLCKAGVSMGGIIGLCNHNITLTRCKNYGTIEQTGNSGLGGNNYRVHLAGILGSTIKGTALTVDITNCENYGAVTYGPTAQIGRVDMGGIMGTSQDAATTTLTGCKNGGVISFLPTGGGQEISCGGIFGTLNKGTLTNCTNLASGHIISKGNSSANFELGGIAGSAAGGAANLYNCDNYGHVDQQVHSKGTTQIGGICGYAYTFGTFDGCDNFGKVSFKGADAGDQVAVGGVVGHSRIKRTNATTAEDGTVTPATVSTISNCANYADQDWSGSRGKSNFQGGVVGYCRSVETGEAVYTNWKNVADIRVGGTATTPYFGGLSGSFGTTSVLDGGVCYGNMYAIGKEGVANYVGFCVGTTRTDTRQVKNIQIGGNMVYAETTETITEEDANGGDPITKVVTTPVLTPLTAENLGSYVYNAAVETSVVIGDGCSYISEKPAVPAVPAN
ncbi:MAG: hypothetical protein IIV16_01870 [Alistipes sp.]|nr:hypothetical protein [Alistipes sp.]